MPQKEMTPPFPRFFPLRVASAYNPAILRIKAGVISLPARGPMNCITCSGLYRVVTPSTYS